MNEACAAGTGSFLEEQAEKLGINIIDEFAELALSARRRRSAWASAAPCSWSATSMAYQQRGARREGPGRPGSHTRSPTNYLNRLVRERNVGDCIFFQGGTAYNDAVAAAFSQILGKEIIVPPHNGVMGALGMALLARETMQRTGAARRSAAGTWARSTTRSSISSARAAPTSATCASSRSRVRRRTGATSAPTAIASAAKVDKEPVIADLVAFREERLMAPYEAARERVPETRRTVGSPAAMYTYDRLPFWATFFAELGLRPVLSPESDKQIREAGVDLTVAEPCFPIRVAHGHVQWLLEQGVDWVFVPNQVNEETEFTQYNSHACPWGQTLPFVVRTAPGIEQHRDRFLTPRVMFREGRAGLVRDMTEMAARLGVGKARLRAALERAYAAQDEFREALLTAGREALETLERSGELGIVLVGRPYNMYDKGVNMDIPRKLRKFYGVNVIPLDFLPIKGIDIAPIVPNMYWNYGRKILQAATFVRERDQPAPDLHDQLQVRPGLVHQALHAPGLPASRS